MLFFPTEIVWIACGLYITKIWYALGGFEEDDQDSNTLTQPLKLTLTDSSCGIETHIHGQFCN